MPKYILTCIILLLYHPGTVFSGVPVSSPVTTVPPSPTKPGGCTYEGKHFNNGEAIETYPDGCGGLNCSEGNLLAWDHACAFITHTCNGRTEKVPGQCCPICHTSTTPPTTVPQGMCFYEGTYYPNGAHISKQPDGCSGLYCSDGGVIAWDDECAFRTITCNGRTEQVPGQCCPKCHVTTTPPTTPPTTVPHGSCYHEGTYYAEGETISEDPDGCYGSVCSGGSLSYWDHKCFLDPPVCEGVEVRIPGQCCRQCLTTPTTTSPTTPVHGPCSYNGRLYNHEQKIQVTTDGCFGFICYHGNIIPWNRVCVGAPLCNSTSDAADDNCCPVCDEVTHYDCIIRGKRYLKGQVTNDESCRFCKCGENHAEVCTNVTCPVLACDKEDAILEGSGCCYTCGSMSLRFSTALLLFALASRVFGFPS